MGEIGADTDADTLVQLTGPSGLIHYVFLLDEPGSGFPGFGESFAFSGMLGPGEYTLLAYSHSCSDEMGFCGIGGGMGFFDFALVVPEPSSGPLLAFGLLGLARRRRASS